MSEFTYMVFTVVASMSGAMLCLFVGVIAAALLLDSSTASRPHSEPVADTRLEYDKAA